MRKVKSDDKWALPCGRWSEMKHSSINEGPRTSWVTKSVQNDWAVESVESSRKQMDLWVEDKWTNNFIMTMLVGGTNVGWRTTDDVTKCFCCWKEQISATDTRQPRNVTSDWFRNGESRFWVSRTLKSRQIENHGAILSRAYKEGGNFNTTERLIHFWCQKED